MPASRLRPAPRRSAFAHACALGCALALFTATGAAAAPRPAPPHLEPVRTAPAPAGMGNLCDRQHWACAPSRGRAEAPEAALELARKVNRSVNTEVREVSDVRQYGREDVWDLPTAQGGDCEDFALAKKKRLIDAGLPAGALMLATVLDRRREHHAVLVLRTASRDFVLDNLTDRMLPWDQTGYSFLRMQDPVAPRRWNAIAAGGIFAATGG